MNEVGVLLLLLHRPWVVVLQPNAALLKDPLVY